MFLDLYLLFSIYKNAVYICSFKYIWTRMVWWCFILIIYLCWQYDTHWWPYDSRSQGIRKFSIGLHYLCYITWCWGSVMANLTHCSLVMPNGAWWQKATTWTNGDLTSANFNDIHLRATIKNIPVPENPENMDELTWTLWGQVTHMCVSE